MGCSSPKVIYWIKNSKNSDKVIENFWDELSNLIKKNMRIIYLKQIKN